MRGIVSRGERILSRLRATHARMLGVELPRPILIERGATFRFWGPVGRPGSIAFGDQAQIGLGAVIDTAGGEIRFGEYCYIGPYCLIYGHGGLTIGDGVMMAGHCRILSSEHTIVPMGRWLRGEPDQLMPTTIGDDCWLGAGVTVTAGVNIGAGCVIGAGAVVTRDIPAGSIAVGVPARVIGQREGAVAAGEDAAS